MSKAVTYRPEVDGLRAIAVLAVVLYHAEFLVFGVNPFKGGFLGVDVFFVISGYLITSILLKEIRHGSLSLRNFYERRVRRILPALFVVMLVSIPFAWEIMRPKALEEFAGSLLSSLFFGANIYFWREDSYTAELSAFKPFLHTWSLSVEEQFYILFPFFLLVAWRLLRRHLAALIVICFLLSLGLAHWASSAHPDAAFFLLPTRAWELLAGALMAGGVFSGGDRNNELLDRFMPSIGLLMIILPIGFFGDQIQHPSLLTLIPVAGAMLVIRFAGRGDCGTRVLSWKPFVWIGLVSYSFYLWHFPILAFARIANVEPLTDLQKMLCVGSAFVLAVITYHLIEKPYRNKSVISWRVAATTLLAAGLLIFISNVFFVKNEGYPDRLGVPQEVLDSAARVIESDYDHEACINHLEFLDPSVWCDIGEKSEDLDFLVIGDSHALSQLTYFNHLAREAGLSGRLVSRSGCPVIGIEPLRGPKLSKDCVDLNAAVLQYVKEHAGIKSVFIVNRWTYYVCGYYGEGCPQTQHIRLIGEEAWANTPEKKLVALDAALKRTVDFYTSLGVQVQLLAQVPQQKYHQQDVFKEYYAVPNLIRDEAIFESRSISRDEHVELNRRINEILNRVAQRHDSVFFHDQTDLFCDSKVCLLGEPDRSYYYDDDHVSVGALKIVEEDVRAMFKLIPAEASR